MEGGILQLAVKGREDVHLTSEPEFSYYETVYKKHTNFSIQNNNYNLVGKKFGQKMEFKIPKGSDLLSEINLEVYLPKIEENITTTQIEETIIDYIININSLNYYLIKKNGDLYLLPEYIFLNEYDEMLLDNLDKYLLSNNDFSFLINNVDSFYIIDLDEIKLLNLKTNLNEKILLFNLNNNSFSRNDFLSTSKIYEKYEKNLNNIIFNNYDFYYNGILSDSLKDINLSSFGEITNFYFKIESNNIYQFENIDNYQSLIDVFGSYFDFINFLYKNHFSYKLFLNYFMDPNFSNINPSGVDDIIGVSDLINPLSNFSTNYEKNYIVEKEYEKIYYTNRTTILQIYDNINLFDKKNFYLNSVALTKYFEERTISPLLLRNEFYFPNKIDVEVNIPNNNLLKITKTTTNKALYEIILETNNEYNASPTSINKNANILVNHIIFLMELIEIFDNNNYVKDIQGFNNFSKDFLIDLSNNENIDYNYLLLYKDNLPQYLPIKIKEIGGLIFLRNKIITLLFKLVNIAKLSLDENENQINLNAYLFLEFKNLLTLKSITNNFNQLLNNSNIVIYSEEDYSGNLNLINRNTTENLKNFLQVKTEDFINIINNSNIIDNNGFYIVEVNFEPKTYANYYYNNELLEYFKDDVYFFKFKENKSEYMIKEIYLRDIPYIDFEYDISNIDNTKFKQSKYEKLQDCKVRKYLIFDENVDLIDKNRIILNLETETYFIDVSNNLEFINKKISFDYESKFYMLRCERNNEVFFKKVNYIGYNNGLILDDNILDKYLYSKIEMYIFNSIYIDIKFDVINNITKPILFRNITNKILENYNFEELNYLYKDIHFGSDISININDLYKLIDYEFLNMTNSFKFITLKNQPNYIYGTIDGITGYYYPVYLTEFEARNNDKDRLALEKTVDEYDIKFYVAINNFNYSSELNEVVKSYKFLEKIQNSINVKLNRVDLSNNFIDLSGLDNFEYEVINQEGIVFNRLRLYHNRKLPNMMNFTSSSISEYPQDIVYDYFVQQPAIIRLKNTNNYLITNIESNSDNIFINNVKVVNLCKIESNQLMRNNFAKMSFLLDDDILLVSKNEIKNIYNNLLTSKYSLLENIDNVIELILGNEKSGLELVKNSSDITRTIINNLSDRFINVSDNLLKYHLDFNNQTNYNIFELDISNIIFYRNNLVFLEKNMNLPWKMLNISQNLVSNLEKDIRNIRDYLINNVNLLIENENLLNKYNSANIDFKLIENYQININNIGQLNEVELYNKNELNLTFLNKIIYNNKKIDYQIDIVNGKIYMNKEDIVETDFYRYSENLKNDFVDIKYLTIKNNNIASLIINDFIFSIIIDDDKNFIKVNDILNLSNIIFNPMIFNINKGATLLNTNNYFKKIRYVYVLENQSNINYQEGLYLVKNIGLLQIVGNNNQKLNLITSNEIENNSTLFINFNLWLIIKELDIDVNVLLLNLEDFDNYYNNNSNNEEIINLGSVKDRYIFTNIYQDTINVENYFIYYENGSFYNYSIDKIILFNINNDNLEKIILVEKSKINLLTILNVEDKDILKNIDTEYFSENYIFDSNILDIIIIEDNNYLVYLVDYQDFYLDLSININLDLSDNSNYLLIDTNKLNKSYLGGYIYYNNVYWKLIDLKNGYLKSIKLYLINPLNNNIINGNYKLRLPIFSNDIYNYRFNTAVKFKKTFNLTWNYFDGLNINLDVSNILININNSQLILSNVNNYFIFDEDVYKRVKFIDTSFNTERILTIVNNQEDFIFDISCGLENDLSACGSFIYLDNSNIIVTIYSPTNIVNVYTDNLLFKLNINQSNIIIVTFDYDNLSNQLNEGTIFIMKETNVLNKINLIVYKNIIYNRLNLNLNGNFMIEPINFLSSDIINIVDISINFNENIFEINDISSVKVKDYSGNVDIFYSINGIYDNIDNYEILNLLSYDLNYEGLLDDSYNLMNLMNLILKKDNDFVVGYDYNFINKYENIEIYSINKEIYYDSKGYIDRNNYIHLDERFLLDDMIIKINGNYYYVIKSYGNISKVKISENININSILNYPIYFNKIIIVGRFIKNSYNYLEHILHQDRNNLFRAIENVNSLNIGDYYIKDNSLNVYFNQDISNCFGGRGNIINVKVFKNMIYFENTFLLDLKVLDVMYDISDNYEEYKIERILDNVILLNKDISDNLVVKNMYVPLLNYILDVSSIIINNNFLIKHELDYGLVKKINLQLEFKNDLCVNWYNNSPNRYSNKVKFNRISNKTYQIDLSDLSIAKLNFYYNQTLGVCQDFFLVDYVEIKDFDISNNIIITDVDISLDSVLFIFNSNELLEDNITNSIINNNLHSNINNMLINPYYGNFIFRKVNLIVFYLIELNSYSTSFIVDIYLENGFYKFNSEQLAIYEDGYYFNNTNILYLIDGLNIVNLVKESNFVYKIEPININPSNLVLITEYYENNKFLTLVKLDKNQIVSNIKKHSNESKFYVNNLFEVKIKNNNVLEYQRPKIKLVKNYRDIDDNYLFVYVINITQREPIFDTIINKFLIEINFLQNYEDLIIESLLLYKIYRDSELQNLVKIIKLNSKIYIETDKLFNYNQLYIVQNNQLKIVNDFNTLDNIYENNLIKNSVFLHSYINIEFFGILRNYLVTNPRLELLNKNIDINKPYNPVIKIYEDNQNIIIETSEELSNIQNITGISNIIDIYQNLIVNKLDITNYSTMNNFKFINLDLDVLYKLSRDNKKLLDNLSLFKNTKNVRFEYINGSIVIDDISSVFLEEEIFYYEVIVSNDVISGLANELREMAIIILDTIEKYNNFGFWVNWKQVLEFKLNQYGFTIKENCLHKLTEDLYVISELSDFIKTDNGYVRKNGITLDVDIIYDNSDNFYILRRDKGKLNNFVDDIINGKINRYGINIDLLLNNIDSITHSVINNDVDINYNYKNEFKSLNQLYLEYLWNKYKNDEIYSNINPNLDFGSDNNKLYRYEIDLNLLDEDRLDTTDIKIYNENIIENAIVFNKKVIFYENNINTDTLTLSTYVRYKIENVEFMGNYYRIDMNNNTFDENLRIKLGEEFIDLLEIDDRVMYVAIKDINEIDHLEYINNIYVKNGSLYVKDYNSSFTFQKSYIFDGNNVYFIPNNYQNSKIYFYCKEFGIRLGLNYNLDLSKNNIDYQVKINVVIVNNRYVFDTSLNNFEKGKIYLFDQSHISNKNYPLKIAKDLSFNDHYYNSYGLAGDNKVIYFAPVELGKVYIYSENQENHTKYIINNPYDFGFNINGIDIIDGSENIVEVDVSVDIIDRVYVLSNQNYETGKIYKFNILNFVKNNFGLSLNLYYLYKGDTYIPIILDDKLINASNSLIIDSFNIYELIEVKGILNIVDLNKRVYKINSELIDRNQDYISSNVEENIFVESDLIIRPFKVYLNSYSEFIVMLDTLNNELKNIIHFSNLNQSLPLNVNSIELKNKIYYDIYINDNQRLNLISNESKIILNDGSNNIIGKVENNQFIIESDKYLELNNEMIINNIYKTEYRTDISNVYLKIPNELLLTFVLSESSDYDLRYIIVDNSNIILDYSGLLLIDISNIVFNEIMISKTDISFIDDMDLYLNQYVRYTGFNKLFDKAEFFNEILVNPFFEVDYDSYVIEIRNNPDFDYIYGLDISGDLSNFNILTESIYLVNSSIVSLDFIYLEQNIIIVASNINISNINKILIGGIFYEINNIINIKKQFRGKYINNKFLIDSDFINFNSNYLNSNYKLKISGFNKIDIKNNFNNEEILINKQVNKTEIIETKLVERNYINDVVFRLFKKIGFYINDELIEELTPDIYQMIYNFHYRKDQKENILKLRKDGDNFKFSLPLEFWFKKNHLNLPLIAMNNTDLYLKIELEDVNKLIDIPINYNPNIKIIVDIDTILLDDKERLLFGSKGHEYIIERYVDYQNYRLNKLQSVNRIPLKGLIKNIYWFGYNYTNNDVFISSEIIENEEKYQEYLDLINRYNLYLENKLPYENDFAIISKNKKLLIIGNNVVNAIKNSNFLKQFDIEFILFLYEKYINPKNNIKSIINKLNLYFVHLYYSKKIIKKESIMKEINIKINGTTLFGKRDNLYYNNVLPNKNLTTIPDDNYYFTSFALHPEEHQPSGHLNFNKLDEFVIISNNDERVLNQAYQLRVIVKEYQIIRIIGGMSSLMW